MKSKVEARARMIGEEEEEEGTQQCDVSLRNATKGNVENPPDSQTLPDNLSPPSSQAVSLAKGVRGLCCCL